MQGLLSEMGYADRGGRAWPDAKADQLTKHTMVLEMRKDAPRGLPQGGGLLPVAPAPAPAPAATATSSAASGAAPRSAAAALAAAIMELDLDSLPVPPAATAATAGRLPPGGVVSGASDGDGVPTITLEEGSALGALIDALPLPGPGDGVGALGAEGMEALVTELFRALHAEGTPR
jgi:hypothetical protein